VSGLEIVGCICDLPIKTKSESQMNWSDLLLRAYILEALGSEKMMSEQQQQQGVCMK
jgi:hypothetical protein